MSKKSIVTTILIVLIIGFVVVFREKFMEVIVSPEIFLNKVLTAGHFLNVTLKVMILNVCIACS
ncbi:MAG: hypothetical protein MK066_14795, partial [Crocinitomicaceae bacterium]|nr:hypothetical protein [Crocinitomicaceae bacterium]